MGMLYVSGLSYYFGLQMVSLVIGLFQLDCMYMFYVRMYLMPSKFCISYKTGTDAHNKVEGWVSFRYPI